jgi:hypothetical protein
LPLTATPPDGTTGRSAMTRRRRASVAVILAIAVIALLVVVLRGGSAEPRLVPGAGSGDETFDPLAFPGRPVRGI